MKIVNITSTAKIAIQLNLDFIASRMWNVEYNPKRFNAIIFRLHQPKVTSLIFKSGKIVTVGAKNFEESKRGARKTARAIQRIVLVPRTIYFKNLKIQNIVMNDNLGFKPNLEEFYKSAFFMPTI